MFIEIANAESKQPKNARLQSAVGGRQIPAAFPHALQLQRVQLPDLG